MRELKMVIFILFFCFLINTAFAEDSFSAEEREATSFLTQLFDTRTQLLINQDQYSITDYYNLMIKTSQKALKQEIKRSNYLNTWARARGIVFTDAEGFIDIDSIRIKGKIAEVSLTHSIRLAYLYDFKNYPLQQFGVGTRHKIWIKKENEKWYILNESYSDPIEENPEMIPVTSVKTYMEMLSDEYHDQPILAISDPSNGRYNRKRAVAYANKYAGAALGAGNGNQYNKRYKDYSDEGGDCTNFASQVIGDPIEGGGLPMLPVWHFSKRSGATISWIRTDSFKDFLLHSGYGKLVGYGYFSDVTQPTPSFPKGAIHELKPGDLIGYEMEGDLDHFSIVIRKDDHGYLLVNSHTGDRYHVPWDIGWDKKTKFWLIHIKD